MQHRQTPFGYILVVDRGEELIRSLIAFARGREVEAAALYGQGAVERVDLGFFHLPTQQYRRRVFEEPLEVCGLVGNVTLLDGEPFPHVHGVFGRPDFSTVGGHVFEAVCSVTLELALHTAPDAIHRGPVDFTTLKLIQLEDRS